MNNPQLLKGLFSQSSAIVISASVFLSIYHIGTTVQISTYDRFSHIEADT